MTNSSITLLTKNGSYITTYVDADGGKLEQYALVTDFNTYDKVDSLISAGSYDSIAGGADGLKNELRACRPVVTKSIDGMADFFSAHSIVLWYSYLFMGGQWYSIRRAGHPNDARILPKSEWKPLDRSKLEADARTYEQGRARQSDFVDKKLPGMSRDEVHNTCQVGKFIRHSLKVYSQAVAPAITDIAELISRNGIPQAVMHMNGNNQYRSMERLVSADLSFFVHLVATTSTNSTDYTVVDTLGRHLNLLLLDMAELPGIDKHAVVTNKTFQIRSKD